MATEKVQLYVYDLSGGLAKQLSMSLLGKQIDGIWHTGVVVGGEEYYFGGGIQRAKAGTTHFGHPVQVIDLGVTEVPREVRMELIGDLETRFHSESYDLLSNNCNNFSNELAILLTGNGIPEHIVKLPDNVMSTPLGQALRPMLTQMESHLGSVSENSASSAPRGSTPKDPKPHFATKDPHKQESKPDSTGELTAAKAEFEAAVKREFTELVAQGVLPNEAAREALNRVKNKLTDC